ncbi:hypothetical protein [Streptacidiphilus jiangxiensis]|uniref:Uncharacterized protein n=1 Tax=Streptacidiphilus jiangxiensis TaxID=235985 RepID=A0A1H7L7K0_STRJI|nr:hypothetical protein [Streptacidiphilus jiangxiensis]SEK94939.1 hypothetical protein SAMN05414137_104378 [Streptacidiphilus jiangxiensis]
MAARSRKDGTIGEGVPLPADLDLETLYGAGAGDGHPDADDLDATDEDDLVLVPPVRLAAAEELAAAALAAPLVAQTVALARWVGEGKPVDEWGELSEEQASAAAAAMGLDGDDVGEVERAWALAVDLELIVLESGQDSAEDAPERGLAGPELARLEAGDPEAVLDAWLTAASVIAQTAVEAAIEDIEAASREDEDEDEDEDDGPQGEKADELEADDESEEEYARLEEAREEAQGLLDDALQVLYETRALAPTAAEQTLPLGVLAALLVVPEGEDPTEELLGEITETMVLLDPMLQELADLGILDYRPIDPSLFEESEDGDAPVAESEELDPEEVDRFGHVRLTDLGLFGVRQWLLEDGIDAPLVGAHAQGDAAELLRGICESANVLPEEEIVEWIQGRDPLAAATELLAAARGDDLVAPVRRLYCQVALRRLGEPAVPAVREVLGDPELVGIAGAWLTELGATDLPQPERATVLWTTVDALAAQLIDTGGQAEAMRELVEMLPGPDGPDRFFDDLWRVDHTYTRAVLEAVGELHPDKSVAKMARKAAYKAKSQGR